MPPPETRVVALGANEDRGEWRNVAAQLHVVIGRAMGYSTEIDGVVARGQRYTGADVLPLELDRRLFDVVGRARTRCPHQCGAIRIRGTRIAGLQRDARIAGQLDLYDLQPQNDSRDETVNLTIGRQLRRTVSLQLSGYGSYDDYTELDARTHQYNVSLTLTKQLARTSIAIYVRRTQQNGSSGASSFAAASYHDDMVGVYFTYDLFGQRNTGGASGMGMPGIP